MFALELLGIILLSIVPVEELSFFATFGIEEVSGLLLGLKSGVADLLIVVLVFSLLNVILTEIFLICMDGY